MSNCHIVGNLMTAQMMFFKRISNFKIYILTFLRLIDSSVEKKDLQFVMQMEFQH